MNGPRLREREYLQEHLGGSHAEILPRLIVGIGSYQGDDGAGWLVLEKLRAEGLPETEFKSTSSPWNVLEWLNGREELVVCDACRGSGAPGRWKRWNWPDAGFQVSTNCGSHDVSLTTILELASRLSVPPRRIVVWTIEVEQLGICVELSAVVVRAVEEVVSAIQQECAGA